MNILEKIVAHKEQEVAERKSLYPEKLLKQSLYFPSRTVSMKKYLLRDDKAGIIAEFKRKSPSKGVINKYASIEKVGIRYMMAGASALSVLTDSEFFGGKNEDLTVARKNNFCPILRKDFIIDPYQIIEAKSIGADCILLIAAILTPDQVKSLSAFAKNLGLEVLLEVHNEFELRDNLHDSVDLIGVNNRNLKNFQVSLDNAKNLASEIPDQYVKVAESGLRDPKDIVELRKLGYRGFLIGETFMKDARPYAAAQNFISSVQELMAAENSNAEATTA